MNNVQQFGISDFNRNLIAIGKMIDDVNFELNSNLTDFSFGNFTDNENFCIFDNNRTMSHFGKMTNDENFNIFDKNGNYVAHGNFYKID